MGRGQAEGAAFLDVDLDAVTAGEIAGENPLRRRVFDLELDHRYLPYLLLCERVEHDHLVDAADELGPEMLADDLHYRLFHRLVALDGQCLDALLAEV